MPLTRLTGLAGLAAELAGVNDAEAITTIITRHAAEILGAASALLATRDGDRMQLVGRLGALISDAIDGDTFSVEADHPLCEAVRTGGSVILLGRDAVAERYPHLVGSGDRSLVAIPLMTSDGPAIGAIGFRFEEPTSRPDAFELQMLQVVSGACTQALTRISAQEQSQERARRLQFLADASEALANSLDYRQTLGTVVDLVVPEFADWCILQVLEEGRLKTLAAEHIDPAKAAMARALEEKFPTSPESERGSYKVARTGQSELFATVTDDMIRAAALNEEQERVLLALELRSVMTVPLATRGRILGVMSFVSSRSDRQFTQEDLAFAEDIARRAAMAIDNADLFSQTQHAAHQLQKALFPQRLPAPPGWDLGALYRQSGRTEVGGDFYDIVVLADGRVAVVIGDVMGRGIDAATASARMSAAVRAYVADDPHPTTVAESLDRLMMLDQTDQLITMAYLLLDPANDCAEIFVAGHLPPLVFGQDGKNRFVLDGGSPAFGVGPVTRISGRIPVLRGDTILLYTDGLVERRDQDIETSLGRLLQEGSILPRDDLDGWLDALVDTMPDEREDDIAIVAIRRHT